MFLTQMLEFSDIIIVVVWKKKQVIISNTRGIYLSDTYIKCAY